MIVNRSTVNASITSIYIYIYNRCEPLYSFSDLEIAPFFVLGRNNITKYIAGSKLDENRTLLLV